LIKATAAETLASQAPPETVPDPAEIPPIPEAPVSCHPADPT
jgi:hypothetical protein